MFQGDGNSYANNSGNSYTYVTNNITISDSFNTSHSHNGHGRGGVCGILAIVLGLGIPVAVLWFIVSVLSEVLVVDETTAVLQRSTTAQALTDVLGQIAQETRKVGVYALCIGQNFHGKIMDTTVRDSFVSFLSCRARRNVAKTMTDNNDFGKLAQDLTIGQAVWMTPAGELH